MSQVQREKSAVISFVYLPPEEQCQFIPSLFAEIFVHASPLVYGGKGVDGGGRRWTEVEGGGRRLKGVRGGVAGGRLYPLFLDPRHRTVF